MNIPVYFEEQIDELTFYTMIRHLGNNKYECLNCHYTGYQDKTVLNMPCGLKFRFSGPSIFLCDDRCKLEDNSLGNYL